MKQADTLFDGLRRKARLGITIEALAWCVLAFTLFVFVSYGADRTLRLEAGFRAVLLVAALASIAWIIARRMLAPMRIELTNDELALAVERQDADLQQSLISAVQFQRDLAAGRELGESTSLMTRVVGEVEAGLRSLPFHRAVDRGRTMRFVAMGMTCALLVGSWFAVAEDAALWARRNLTLSSEPWPRDTQLEFLGVAAGATLRIAERDDVTIRVAAKGVVPDNVVLECEFGGGTNAERTMEQIGDNVFTVTLGSVLEDVVVQAFGGDGISDRLRIELVPRPKIEQLAIEIEFPAYLERERESVADLTGDVTVPTGSTLHVRATSDKPLVNASLVFADDQRVAATLEAGGRAIVASWRPEQSGTLTVDGLDADRLGPSRAPQVFLRLVDDTAPTVEFRTDGIGSLITAIAIIPGKLTLEDDHGLVSVGATMQISDAVQATDADGEAVAPAPFESAPVQGLEGFAPRPTTFEAETALDLQTMTPAADPIDENRRIKPGKLLALRFTATDAFQPDAHLTHSDTMHFRVVTREKLLEELKRRQAEQRRELERVLAREVTLRAELAEIVSPTGDDPRAEQAKLSVLAFARRQQALGRRVQGIGERYRRILLELLNNRLFQQPVTRAKQAKIVTPLLTLAAQDFPSSSVAISEFAESGAEPERAAIDAQFGRIIASIQRVLGEMEHTEDIAAVLEALRVVIRTEEQAKKLIEKQRDAGVNELFGDPPESGDGRDKDR